MHTKIYQFPGFENSAGLRTQRHQWTQIIHPTPPWTYPNHGLEYNRRRLPSNGAQRVPRPGRPKESPQRLFTLFLPSSQSHAQRRALPFAQTNIDLYFQLPRVLQYPTRIELSTDISTVFLGPRVFLSPTRSAPNNNIPSLDNRTDSTQSSKSVCTYAQVHLFLPLCRRWIQLQLVSQFVFGRISRCGSSLN